MTSDPVLTLVIPTHNRPRHCLAQLRFLRDCGVTHPILIADSSREDVADDLRVQCAGRADYAYIDPSINIAEKFSRAARAVSSPFVVMLPDDDITFPHAIEASSAHLLKHQDYVAAHGYTLRFGLHENDIDVHSVFSFVPSIDADAPLHRHYDLMRRYQPFMWAVFRTEIFRLAMAGAAAAQTVTFQEFTFMSRAVLKGKIARLPVVFSMRGMEESHTPANESNPFMWFLNNPTTFYGAYLAYRDELAAFVRAEPALVKHLPPTTAIEQLLDINHATLFGRAIDMGMINHQAQLLLGLPLPPIKIEPQWSGWRPPEVDDAVHVGRLSDRRYIWRKSVLRAEPRDEILITSEEVAITETELDKYRLD